MIKILPKIILLWYALNICHSANAEAIIRGTISNTDEGKVSYNCKEHILEHYVYKEDMKLVNNQFEIRVDNVDPVQISFYFDHEQLDFFLFPNDSISFSCDAKNLKNSLKIISNNYDDQVFMTSMSMIESLKSKAMAPYEVKGTGWKDLPDGMVDSLDKVVATQQDGYEKTAISKLALSKDLRIRVIDTTYKKASQMMTQYFMQNATVGNMKLKNAGKEITDDDINQLISNLKIENKELVQNTYYIDFLYWYDAKNYHAYCNENGLAFPSEKDWAFNHLQFQEKYYTAPAVRYAIETHTLCKNDFRKPDVFTEGVARINQMYPNGAYKAKLEQMALSVHALYAGEPAPDFSLKSIDGKTVSLKDLKGKVLYIDFWASWCLPCMEENKVVKDIKPLYKDKDVVFVYIIRDNNEAIWKEAVAKQEIEGLHLLGGGSPVFDLYQADGVPKYVLIDKDGKIVSADAPRPSDTEKLKELLDKTLAQ